MGIGVAKDFAGQRMGRLIAVAPTGGSTRYGRIWLFRCDCGKEVRRAAAQLGDNAGCGCRKRGRANIVGHRFTRWIVLSAAGNAARGVALWLCRCDCGKEKVIPGGNLKSGMSRSCGCLAVELFRARATKHGMSKSAEYHTWTGMRRRCQDENDPAYENYGGRGILVCSGWSESFENFFADMGKRPSSDLSIDRRDNERGYDCGHCVDCVARGATPNCKWATQAEQMRNIRKNIWIEVDGVRMTQSEWARQRGISRQILSLRIKRGMSPEDAVMLPLHDASFQKGKRPNPESAMQRAKSVGVSYTAYRRGVRLGLSDEEIAARVTDRRANPRRKISRTRGGQKDSRGIRLYVCGGCGHPGHNVQTCPARFFQPQEIA